MASDALCWQPTASLDVVKQRAVLLKTLRRFFAQRSVLEVDTPALSMGATPVPELTSFETAYQDPTAPGRKILYLQTSPEFHMKRLLASKSGPIYQICKVFRDEEAGPLHNPEFTLLEWYRPGFELEDLMDEVEQLVRVAVDRWQPALPFRRLTYRDLFLEYANVDGLTGTAHEMKASLQQRGIELPIGISDEELDAWRDYVLTHVIVPQLRDAYLFVYDYPESQAALAQVRGGPPPVAQRFELICLGVELANGFQELTDAGEQRRRFEDEQQKRLARGRSQVTLDDRFLAALQSGMPTCAGVALGVDRLLMLATGACDIRQVLSFPINHA